MDFSGAPNQELRSYAVSLGILRADLRAERAFHE